MTKMRYIHTENITCPQKGMKFWYMLQHRWSLKPDMGYHMLYDCIYMNVQNRQIGKSTETKSKLVARGWIEKGMESIANGYGVSWLCDKKKILEFTMVITAQLFGKTKDHQIVYIHLKDDFMACELYFNLNFKKYRLIKDTGLQ